METNTINIHHIFQAAENLRKVEIFNDCCFIIVLIVDTISNGSRYNANLQYYVLSVSGAQKIQFLLCWLERQDDHFLVTVRVVLVRLNAVEPVDGA